jgi:hypothetical protein
MIEIRVVDYPRFLSALKEARRELAVPRGHALTREQFKQMVKDSFDLDIEVHYGDQIGLFYLHTEQDAVMFMLRWG